MSCLSIHSLQPSNMMDVSILGEMTSPRPLTPGDSKTVVTGNLHGLEMNHFSSNAVTSKPSILGLMFGPF